MHQVKRLKAQVEAMTQRLKLGEEAVKEAEEKERMARREAARLQVKTIERMDCQTGLSCLQLY